MKNKNDYLDRLNKLNVYSYTLKTDPIKDEELEQTKERKYFKNKSLTVGLISEEVEELFDNATDNLKLINLDEENNREIKKNIGDYEPEITDEEYIERKNKQRGEVIGIEYDTLLCYTILAIQELTEKVEILQEKIKDKTKKI